MMWNVDVGKLLGCFEVFVCMGVFGLYCVLMFWVVQWIYLLDEFGYVVFNLLIVQMIGFFMVIGWVMLILVCVLVSDGWQVVCDVFYLLVLMVGWMVLVVMFVCVLVLVIGFVVFDFGGVVVLMWGWIVYQFVWYFFVLMCCYWIMIVFDCLLIVGLCVMFQVGMCYGYFVLLCLVFMLIGVVVVMFVVIGVLGCGGFVMWFDMKGLQFGLINFLFGGIVLVMLLVVKVMCGVLFVGMLLLFVLVIVVGNLLLCVILIVQLFDFVKWKKDKVLFDMMLGVMWCNIDLLNLVVFVVNLVMVVGLIYWVGLEGDDEIFVFVVGVLLVF